MHLIDFFFLIGVYLHFTVGYLLVVAVITLVLCIQCISVWIEVVLQSVTNEGILASFEKRAKQKMNINSQKTCNP